MERPETKPGHPRWKKLATNSLIMTLLQAHVTYCVTEGRDKRNGECGRIFRAFFSDRAAVIS
jgi:hypothetical protein